MTVIDVNSKIEVWKNKLLDLGKRNRLINYKETKRSSLKILTPEFSELFSSFVQEEQPIVFPNFSSLMEDEEQEDIAEINYPIKTNRSPKETQQTLKLLRDKAKIANEEQGINILYLSFGFLKWTESQDSDYWFNSPILLVPVSITIESIVSPFILNLNEDEIIINPTLAFKLENDFGITLPKYNEGDDIQIILNEISSIVENNKWEVTFDVSLSLLSFLKINMYNDLSKHKDSIAENPIIRTISGDSSASNIINIIPGDISDSDYDKNITPEEMFQVVDADSSQQDAIQYAKKGISFVLQGPPGTGKSQTITNIIAECLADGKKVLFVSEKMAALDVVHRRLTNSGLNDFCLILHSNKASKREVLDQLRTTLALAQKKATLNDDIFLQLELLKSNKEQLNEYAKQVFETVMPLQKSIYQVNGILANLESFNNVIFQIENIGNIDAKQFNRFIYLLQQYTSTVGKMTTDYFANPWYDSLVSAVSHELRYDLEHKLGALIPKINISQLELDAIYKNISLKWDTNYQGIIDIIPIMKMCVDAPVVPTNWITGKEIEPFFDEVAEYEELKTIFWQKHSELSEQYSLIASNDEIIMLSNLDELITAESIEKELNTIKSIMDTFPYSGINTDYYTADKLLNEASDKANQLSEIINLMSEIYEKTVFTIDYININLRFKTEYTSFLKVFNKNYKTDKKTILAQYKKVVKNVSDEQVLELISQLRIIDELKQWFSNNQLNFKKFFGVLLVDEKSDFGKIEKYKITYNSISNSIKLLEVLKNTALKLEKSEKTLISHYQFLYKGFDTEWGTIRKALIWSLAFRKQVEKLKLNSEFVEMVCSGINPVSIYKDATFQLEAIINNLDSEFLWFIGLFENQDYFKLLTLPTLQDRLINCQNGLFQLEEWIDFRSARENCKAEGLADFMIKIEEMHINSSEIINVFKKRFFRLWLDAILPNYPAVLNFRRKVQEKSIDEFSRLDKIQFDIAKARIRSKLINDLPSLQRFTTGSDEISILKRELGKQRRIMPIRKLFREIPNLLLTLKPCLLMSPLSVSLFLEAESYQFDTVIFDEASQVCTENAIGAISRGKQVIIAGDSKQLPPTNFFSASTSSESDFDSDDDEYDSTDAYESILDEAVLLPERTLLWHYRSRHEHLIAFSNAKIYKNNLITFPSSVDKMTHNGVEFVYVSDGYYDRGGKKGNVIEAQKVAEMVFEHFIKFPNRSLGVITFGEVQQMAIDTAIRAKRLKNPNFESFFKEDSVEPFFIKNLENVQGDERDTIIFSIGYAKDIFGVFRMNFGPLNKPGGERRLNVAITRAKYNLKLVGSIMPTEIDVDKISSEGPKLLRAYIDFAQNGVESLIRTMTEVEIAEHDSPFEESVYKYLDRKGYKIVTQVGCSGYRIDMAVKHPTQSGIYVLGIECDGASYHSARTARERDRLRQEVLENMGWKIYRIWSTDWIKDPITEGDKLVDAIEKAISSFGEQSRKEPMKVSSKDEKHANNFVSENIKKISEDEQSNPYGFATYKETDFSILPKDEYDYLEPIDALSACVYNEFPIHFELLCKKIAPYYGYDRATPSLKKDVEYDLQSLSGAIVRKGEFLFPYEYDKITVRIPNERRINYVSIQELAEAMNTILTKSVGITREGLCLETTRVYGWLRMTQGIAESMYAACDELIEQGKVLEIDGKIIPKN